VTRDGEVIGTAAYMSPEQARGELGRLSPRSDVYALGAMLYQLLAREMPYASDAKTTAQVLERVRRGPPRPLTSFDERAAPELVAICSKAMAREPEQRYANLSEVADDLRAYLEGRVVRAHATGAWTTARKWARRNRALTLSLVAILIAAAVGVWQARRSAVVRANFDMLARLRQRTELLDDYEALWPATPATLPALERWLTSAEGAASQLDGYRAQLAELRSRALPWNELSPSEQRVRRQLDADTERARRLIAHLEEQRDELRRTGAERSFDGATLAEVERQIEYDRPVIAQREAKLVARQTWSFEAPIDQLMHDRLVALIPDTERLTDRERGFSRIERVRHAIAVVREIERRDPAATSAAWERARAAIRDLAQCPMYAGLDLKPQPGLLPLGPDPSSGLWEFAHLATGAPPTRDAHGRLAITPESGLVLVLLPRTSIRRRRCSRDRPRACCSTRSSSRSSR
jgi:hypothetical protein